MTSVNISPPLVSVPGYLPAAALSPVSWGSSQPSQQHLQAMFGHPAFRDCNAPAGRPHPPQPQQAPGAAAMPRLLYQGVNVQPTALSAAGRGGGAETYPAQQQRSNADRQVEVLRQRQQQMIQQQQQMQQQQQRQQQPYPVQSTQWYQQGILQQPQQNMNQHSPVQVSVSQQQQQAPLSAPVSQPQRTMQAPVSQAPHHSPAVPSPPQQQHRSAPQQQQQQQQPAPQQQQSPKPRQNRQPARKKPAKSAAAKRAASSPARPAAKRSALAFDEDGPCGPVCAMCLRDFPDQPALRLHERTCQRQLQQRAAVTVKAPAPVPVLLPPPARLELGQPARPSGQSEQPEPVCGYCAERFRDLLELAEHEAACRRRPQLETGRPQPGAPPARVSESASGARRPWRDGTGASG